MQEQAVALLSQLHSREPDRAANKQKKGLLGSAGLSHARHPQQQLLLTPGMGSVGSVSPSPLGRTQGTTQQVGRRFVVHPATQHSKFA